MKFKPLWKSFDASLPALIRRSKKAAGPLVFASTAFILGSTFTIERSYTVGLGDALSVAQRLIVTEKGKKQFPITLVTVVFLTATGAQTYSVPSDWNSGNNSVECIGGGASGGAIRSNSGSNVRFGTGGGAGGYGKSLNITLTPGGTTPYACGAGGAAVVSSVNGTGVTGNAAGDTFFDNSTYAAATTGGKGGLGGLFQNNTTTSLTGALGGAGKGNSANFNGGAGGSVSAGSNDRLGTGGGGAAGPNSAGAAAVTNTADNSGTNGGRGDGTFGGAAGIGGTSTPAGNGGNGTEYDASHGSGGGGGGITIGGSSCVAGNGGNYGAAGGGAATSTGSSATSGSGANGLIVLTYTPSTSSGPRFRAFIFG